MTLAITTRRRRAARSEQSFYDEAESDARENLAAGGALRAVLRRLDGRGFVLLLDTVSAEAALEIMDMMPTVEMGISAYRVLAVEVVV